MGLLTYIAYLFRYKGILVLDSLDYKTRQNSSIRFTSFLYRLLIEHLLQDLRIPFYSYIRNRQLFGYRLFNIYLEENKIGKNTESSKRKREKIYSISSVLITTIRFAKMKYLSYKTKVPTS